MCHFVTIFCFSSSCYKGKTYLRDNKLYYDRKYVVELKYMEFDNLGKSHEYIFGLEGDFAKSANYFIGYFIFDLMHFHVIFFGNKD